MIEEHSPTWRAVVEWAGDRLAIHRRRLETVGLDHAETEGARHAIQELQTLLSLTKPSKIPIVDVGEHP